MPISLRMIFAPLLTVAVIVSGCVSSGQTNNPNSESVTQQEALSKPDQAYLTQQLSQVLAVDSSRIVMHDIRKDSKVWGVAGHKYFFDVTILNTANSNTSTPREYLCQAYWHQLKKGQPTCSEKR